MKHFSALGGAAVVVVRVADQHSSAAVIYSGVVNIPITSTIDGVYLNVVTGAHSSTSSVVPGWDLNPYQSSATGPAMSFFTATTASGGNAPAASRGYVSGYSGGIFDGPVLNLPYPTVIGSDNSYNVTIGAGTNFPPGSSGFIGFRFQNETNGNATHYGWAQISRLNPNSGSIGVIVDYAYSNVPGRGVYAGSGEFPEPTSLGLLALGAVGLAVRRR